MLVGIDLDGILEIFWYGELVASIYCSLVIYIVKLLDLAVVRGWEVSLSCHLIWS
jgi:hypothetical protein